MLGVARRPIPALTREEKFSRGTFNIRITCRDWKQTREEDGWSIKMRFGRYSPLHFPSERVLGNRGFELIGQIR